MLKRIATIRRGSSIATLSGFGAALLVASLLSSDAEARHRHHFAHHGHHGRHLTHARGGALPHAAQNIAAIVVDANSGRTLYARNENELRHPASITKVMTLYLLFEELEKGHLQPDSEIRVSAHAAAQKPTKLGLRAGRTIAVENAIKAVVTRSANDMAVAIAEAIGGDESTFAEMMTRKAHALGMSRTHFENASGLPNDDQVTTAYDLAILGRAIQERFPRYYHYFSTRVFYYAGRPIMNHNHLMDRVEGMDGIKTGYTRASGFNLLTSVKRNGHHIVAAVLGGASAAGRDRVMAGLIEENIDDGATIRTAATMNESAPAERIADNSAAPESAPRHIQAEIKPEAEIRPEIRTPPKPQTLKAEAPVAPVELASIDNEVPVAKPRPAFVSGTSKTTPAEDRAATAEPTGRRVVQDGSTAQAPRASTPVSTATPSNLRWVVGPAGKERGERQMVAKAENSKTETAKTDTVKGIDTRRPAAARSGWMIQIGATDDVAKAADLLARAKSEGRKALTSAQPFTEKVQKGSETLYRARFAGLEEDSAESACKTLKRSGFSCFATKN
jgi:D-alanyl-D-alanine carboxypeptidase